MRRLMKVAGLGFLMLVSLRFAPALPGGSEVVLLDAPRGAWVASVRADAALTVIEERDGWRKVRIEGWTTTGQEEPPPPASATAPARAVVTGVLVPLSEQQSETVGAGLLVLLVGDRDRLKEEHRILGEECVGGVNALDARIADREAALRKALNSNDNFTIAAKRNDQAKAELAAARKERAEYVERCQDRADGLFSAGAVARAISDATGRYEFPGVPTGRYWVVAGDHHGATARAWWLDCNVSGSEAIVLDPRAADPVGDPYWGLR